MGCSGEAILSYIIRPCHRKWKQIIMYVTITLHTKNWKVQYFAFMFFLISFIIINYNLFTLCPHCSSFPHLLSFPLFFPLPATRHVPLLVYWWGGPPSLLSDPSLLVLIRTAWTLFLCDLRRPLCQGRW